MERKSFKALKKVAKGGKQRFQIPEEQFKELSKWGYIHPTNNHNESLVITDKGKQKLTEERERRWDRDIIIAVTILVGIASIITSIVLWFLGQSPQ